MHEPNSLEEAYVVLRTRLSSKDLENFAPDIKKAIEIIQTKRPFFVSNISHESLLSDEIKAELMPILKNDYTSSNIEDFIEEHPDIPPHNIWNFVCENELPELCRGCMHVQMSGMHPCEYCARNANIKDRYEPTSLPCL